MRRLFITWVARFLLYSLLFFLSLDLNAASPFASSPHLRLPFDMSLISARAQQERAARREFTKEIDRDAKGVTSIIGFFLLVRYVALNLVRIADLEKRTTNLPQAVLPMLKTASIAGTLYMKSWTKLPYFFAELRSMRLARYDGEPDLDYTLQTTFDGLTIGSSLVNYGSYLAALHITRSVGLAEEKEWTLMIASIFTLADILARLAFDSPKCKEGFSAQLEEWRRHWTYYGFSSYSERAKTGFLLLLALFASSTSGAIHGFRTFQTLKMIFDWDESQALQATALVSGACHSALYLPLMYQSLSQHSAAERVRGLRDGNPLLAINHLLRGYCCYLPLVGLAYWQDTQALLDYLEIQNPAVILGLGLAIAVLMIEFRYNYQVADIEQRYFAPAPARIPVDPGVILGWSVDRSPLLNQFQAFLNRIEQRGGWDLHDPI